MKPMENYTPRTSRPAMNTETKETVEPSVTPVTRSFSSASPKKKRPSSKWLKWLLGAVLAVLLVGVAVSFCLRAVGIGNNVDGSKYQAVFLTSGQVYFGKLQFLNDSYVKLTDVFYIQTSSTTDGENPQTTEDSSDMQLIKLGNEIHGPDDAMVISRDQMLFYENLKADGKVTQSIQKYKTENK